MAFWGPQWYNLPSILGGRCVLLWKLRAQSEKGRSQNGAVTPEVSGNQFLHGLFLFLDSISLGTQLSRGLLLLLDGVVATTVLHSHVTLLSFPAPGQITQPYFLVTVWDHITSSRP